DLDVDVSRKVETHQRVDSLRRRVDDVDQTLVGAHLEVLAAVLVLVGRPDDAHDVLLGRKRHGADDSRARTGHGVDDLTCRGVDDLVVIRLQANADLLSRHCLLSLYKRLTVRDRVALGHWTHVGAVRASALLFSGSWTGIHGPVEGAAPLFCCHSARRSARIPTPAMQAQQDPCEEVSDCVFCCPRPRTLRMLTGSAPSMHCRDSDPAHHEEHRNVEPVYSATTDSTTANPGVSRLAERVSRRWAEHPPAPPSAMEARWEGTHRAGGVGEKGCRRPRSEARPDGRAHDDASADTPRDEHVVPQDESPFIRTLCSSVLRRADPQAAVTV